MKKLLFVSFLLIIFLAKAKCQENYVFGFKAGMNVSKLKNFDGDAKKGFVGGIFFEYPMSEGFSIQSETLLSFQGAKGINSMKDIDLTYLNWPILMKLYPTEGINFVVGPQVDFLLTGKGGTLEKKQYKTFELGLVGGIGINLTDYLSLEARYIHGLTKVTKVNDFKNSIFQFTLGVTL